MSLSFGSELNGWRCKSFITKAIANVAIEVDSFGMRRQETVKAVCWNIEKTINRAVADLQFKHR